MQESITFITRSFINGTANPVAGLMGSGIGNPGNEQGSGFSLSQNFPNPFGTSTKITFSITKTSPVKLVVYDITGIEVQDPCQKNLTPELMKTIFNGASLNSGVYFYKLTSGDFSREQEMIFYK